MKQVPISQYGSPLEAHDALFKVQAIDEASGASLIRLYAPRNLVRILSGASTAA